MLRRRFATTTELVRLVAEDDLDHDTVATVVERLAELGVPVDALVRIEVTEELAQPAVPEFRAAPAPGDAPTE